MFRGRTPGSPRYLHLSASSSAAALTKRRGDRLVVTAILVGRRAPLEHFGLGIAHRRHGAKMRMAADTVAWDAVVRLTPGKVIVRDSGASSRRPERRPS